MARQRLGWAGAPLRRGVGLALWTNGVGAGTHPAVLVENRGAGVGLYTQAAMSTRTQVAVVPSTAIFTSAASQRRSLRCPVSGLDRLSTEALPADFGATTSALTCCADWREWAELSWRLAVDLCSRPSRWWGWHGHLPPQAALASSFAGDDARAALQPRYPHLFGQWRQIARRVANDADAVYEHLAAASGAITPPRALFHHAVMVTMRRATWLPDPTAAVDDGLPPVLGFVPLVDCAMRAPLLPSSSSSSGEQLVPQGANAVLEIVEDFSELPEWYRRPAEADSSVVFDGVEGDLASGTGAERDDARKRALQFELLGGIERFELTRRKGVAPFHVVLTLTEDVAASAPIAVADTPPSTAIDDEMRLLAYGRCGRVDPPA